VTINRPNQNSWIALLAFICAIFFTLTIVFAHAVTDHMIFASDTLSRYGLEKYGFVLGLGFCCIGLTQFIIAYLLLKQTNDNQLTPVSVFLLLSGMGVIIVAAIPTQLPPASIIDRLPHIIGAVMQFFFFPVALLLLSRKLLGGTFKRYTTLTGITTALLFTVLIILFVSPSMKDFAYFGLIEKVDILAINLWLILMAFVLYKSSLITKQGAS
jgi:hypothetical protein